jgi:hypothetical protein
MGQQVFDRDLVPALKIREVFTEAIIQRQFVLLNEFQNNACRKLFGGRADLVDRIRSIRYFFSRILVTKGFFINDLSILADQYRTIETVEADRLLDQGIYLLFVTLGLDGEG